MRFLRIFNFVTPIFSPYSPLLSTLVRTRLEYLSLKKKLVYYNDDNFDINLER